MANKYFKGNFEECTIDKAPLYLYIDNVEDFLDDCRDDWISDNVNKPGIYQWDDFYEVWILANSAIEKKIRALVEEINSLRQENPSQNNKFICWNILVTLDTDETIKINSETVSIKEIHEAIDILLKPSFFGKRIKKFEIVAE